MSTFNPEEHPSCHKVYFYLPVTDSVSHSMYESLQEQIKDLHIDYDAIRNMIYCGVIVRKPIGSTVPSRLNLEEILAASPLLVPRGDGSYLSLDRSVIISLYNNRIFFEPAREGGRKQQKRFNRYSMRLFGLILMNHFGVSCRVRLKAKERAYIAQFGQ